MACRDSLNIVTEIAALVGQDAATAFQRAFGGQCIHFPKTIKATHPIAVAIGLDNARKVARELLPIGMAIVVPIGRFSALDQAKRRQDAAIDQLLAEGFGRNQIAKLLGCSSRTVQRRRVRASQAGRPAPTPRCLPGLTTSQKSMLQAALSSGETDNKTIARQVGCTATTIARYRSGERKL